jgi:hypothetical protein
MSGLKADLRASRLVHREIREAIGFLVELAADVLEGHAPDAPD